MANMNEMATPTPTPTNASMVLVMGETGAGKSYFVKALAPDNESVVVGHSMKSCSSAPFIPDSIQRF
jgi:transcriptional regulator with AAA-type ATPase domain